MGRSDRVARWRRWLIGAGVGAALVAGVGVAAPVVVGMQSQARLDTITTRASERMARLEWSIESFEQGAYSSRATTRMTWRFPEAQRPPATLELRHRIHHGPRPDGLYWARVETVPVVEGGMGTRLARIYGERDPLSATYTEGVTGNQSLRVRSPAVDTQVDGGRFTSQGLELRIDRRKGDGRVTIDGALPGLELRAGDARIDLHELTVAGELDQSKALTTGHVRLALAGLDVQPRRTASRGAEAVFAVRGLRVSERLDQRDGALAGRLSVEAHDLAVARKRYRALAAEVGVEGIPAGLVERLSRAAREAQAQGRPAWPAMASTFQAHSPGEAVAHAPRLRIERIEAQTPSGPVRLDGHIGVPGLEGDTIQGWLQVLLALEARLRVDLPQGLARALAARYLARQAERSGTVPSQAQLEALAAERLTAFEREGWINRREGQVATEMTYEAGALRINGQRVIDLGRMFGG